MIQKILLNYELIGVLIFVILVLIPPALTIIALLDRSLALVSMLPQHKYLMKVAVIVDIIAVICAYDAFCIEPNVLTITRIHDVSPKVAISTGELKIVQISDIHFERNTERSAKVLRAAMAEKPDLILITGDTTQWSRFYTRELKDYLTRLTRIAPLCAIMGNSDSKLLLQYPLGDHMLTSGATQKLNVRGTNIIVQGYGFYEKADRKIDPGNALYIVLHHVPDQILEAKNLHPDWIFCGHTHGGQVRLPFWGAIITNCMTGKRFEYGRYKVDGMNVFVTRGVGLDPFPAPPARFLCPPEMVVLTIRSKG